jgi:hypothetical protein
MALAFPLGGLDVSLSFERQPVRPDPGGGTWATTADCLNVRATDPGTGTVRGAARPGIDKWVLENVADARGGGGGVPISLSNGQQLAVAVSGGNVYTAPVNLDAGEVRVWTAATNNASTSPPLTAVEKVGLIWAQPFQGRTYFVDGEHYVYYDPLTNSVEDWVADAPGVLPTDDDGNACRLIELWGGSIILSGLPGNPGQIFASAIGDANNWDYAPESPSAADAWTLTSGNLGLVGDNIMAMVPANNNVLLIGGTGSLEMLNGNPLAGGQKLQVTNSVGMPWGRPWAVDPNGAVWFASATAQVYAMEPTGSPVLASAAIAPLLDGIDTGTNAIVLAWNDRYRARGLSVFVTPNNAALNLDVSNADDIEATHYFYEPDVGSWWKDRFSPKLYGNAGPTAVCPIEGNAPEDRTVLLGGWDGWVRYISPDLNGDDDRPFPSHVLIGPVLTPNLDAVMITSAQVVLGTEGEEVDFKIQIGKTAEEASQAVPVLDKTLTAGRSWTFPLRRSAYAIYVRLSSAGRWAMESCRLAVESLGDTKMRGR